MSSSEVQDLLRQGIEAARSNDRKMARDLLQQVVDQDENNEKGWFWLASVVDSEEERRVCLSNVLHINPNNEKARQAMDAIEAKARKKANAEEVMPGITRGSLTLIVGGGVLVIVVIVVAFAAIVISNNNAIAAQRAEQTNVALLRTDTAGTATQGALFVTQTFEALVTDTPVVTPTPPTPDFVLPPTWTPIPTETLTPTPVALPPVTGLSGYIAAYGGRDVLNNGYLSVGFYNLNQNGTFFNINSQYGRDISFLPNGQRVVYARYDQLTFTSVLETVNVNGTDVQAIDISRAGVPIINPLEPRFSDDGQYITFVARSTGMTPQLFLYNLRDNSMRQLTNDDSVYSSPDFSPDGTQIAVIRNDVNSATPGEDIVLVNVSSGGQVPVTNDKGAYIEAMPRWLDNQTIVYSQAASTDPDNFDIWYRPSNGGGSALPFVRQAGSDLYPVVSRDGQYIAFGNNARGNWDIFVYNIQANTIMQLTQTPDSEYPTDWWMP